MITAPCASARQVSGQLDPGRPILSVLAKRRYRFAPDGATLVGEEEVPLVEGPEIGATGQDLAADSDLFPWKPRTDVIVRGHAYAHGAGPEVVAAVRIGNQERRVVVVGDRRIVPAAAGPVRAETFTTPEPWTQLPLDWGRAYGGRDEVAERRHGNPLPAVFQSVVESDGIDLRHGGLFVYPRNPIGRGFVLEATREGLEAARLPNFEDPDDRLTPARVVPRDALEWPRQPVPAGFGVWSYGWFPRCALAGFIPFHRELGEPYAEVARFGYPADLSDPSVRTPARAQAFLSCAAPGMAFPLLQGRTAITLRHLHPTAREFLWRLHLKVPEILTDGRQGSLKPTQPVVHTLWLEPDTLTATVLWRGAADALRPYTDEELARMPFVVRWP